MAERYNFPTLMRGDTFEALEFEFLINDVAINLTGYQILCKFRKGGKTGKEVKSILIGSGITITDMILGKFEIDRFQTNNLRAGRYYYDIEIIDSNGISDTYIEGTIELIQDTTYE